MHLRCTVVPTLAGIDKLRDFISSGQRMSYYLQHTSNAEADNDKYGSIEAFAPLDL